MTEQKKINRRQVIKYSLGGAALTALAELVPETAVSKTSDKRNLKTGKIVVVGAGAFGGWTALHLLRKGYDVTLIDQFGPGNNQSSSGGETRLIRAFYDKQIYFDLTCRAVELWKENEPRMGQKVLFQNGLILFNYKQNTPELDVAWPMYKKAGLPIEKISLADAAKRWPQVRTEGLDHIMYDPNAGYLEARKGCIAVADLFIKEGGSFLQQKVQKESIANGKVNSITLADGKVLEAESFVFACGPWLTRLFPALTKKLKVTRALEIFVASPSDQSDFMENKLPTWMDRDLDGPFRAFGVPGSAFRGFKIGITPPMDNNVTDRFDTYDRLVRPEELMLVQKLVASRFPKLVGQPVIEQRVCQYTMTPDTDFILDQHPEASNLWVMGGDSGHGYKLGASFGEMAASTVLKEIKVNELFALKRLLG